MKTTSLAEFVFNQLRVKGRTWIPGAMLVLLAIPGEAQTHTVLKSFGSLADGTGGRPSSPLVRAVDGTLYGATTRDSGSASGGSIFKINSDGTGYTRLKSFAIEGTNGSAPHGGGPVSLVLAGEILYGVAMGGGDFDAGTVFKLNRDGTAFTLLKHLNGPVTGATPSSLILSGNTLFGTTMSEGSEFGGGGTVFKLNTDGSGFSVLKSFAGSVATMPQVPSGRLVLVGTTLYGTTQWGGSGFYGTIFKVNTDGSGFAVLKSLSGPTGQRPVAGLIESGGQLYGATAAAGNFGGGTVFKLSANGTGFTVLRHLANGIGPSGELNLFGNTLFGATRGRLDDVSATTFRVNTDGSGFAVLHTNTIPEGVSLDSGLMLDGETLYGTAAFGGVGGLGTIFKLKTDGGNFTVLKQFTSLASLTGKEPLASGLLLSGNTLFGTTKGGGNSKVGTLYRVKTDGSAFAVVKQFTGDSTNGEAAEPNGGLVQSGNTLYGMSSAGGTAKRGTVFKVNTDGSDYAVLKSFTAADGGIPADAGLVFADGILYGTLSGFEGKVFKLNPDGSGYTVLANVSNPRATLLLSGNTLYGTTAGGDMDSGTVFKVNIDGSGHEVLKVFDYATDGGTSVAGLALSGNTLYGTTAYGGEGDKGTIFKVNTDGTGFTVLRHFAGFPDDGASPFAALLVYGNKIYGTTSNGGTRNTGIIFQMNTDGSDFTVLKHCNYSDGDGPTGNLVLDDGILYGTTAAGGALGFGTVFSLALPGPPKLFLIRSGTNVVLSWPTLPEGFTLQSTTNLAFAAEWATVSTPPSVANGRNTVTNAVDGAQRFYRLSQ